MWGGFKGGICPLCQHVKGKDYSEAKSPPFTTAGLKNYQGKFFVFSNFLVIVYTYIFLTVYTHIS